MMIRNKARVGNRTRLLKGTHRNRRFGRRPLNMEPLEDRVVLTGFTAYNGLFASDMTNANTTLYSPIGADQSGPLKDIATGVEQTASLSTLQLGVVFDANGSQPASGTDASNIFTGFVDFSAGDQRSIEIDSSAAYQYSFDNLDPGATYQFAGTAIRGNDTYTNRWTLVELQGASSFTVAHSEGDGVVTDGLTDNQVAIWAGDNARSGQGWVAQWLDIDPGPDGVFRVTATQYQGDIPTTIDPDGVADGSKSYGVSGIRLIENAPEGPPVVQNTAPANVLAFEAEVGGEVTSTGGSVPDVAIYYGTTDGGTNPLAWDAIASAGKASRDFSVVLDGLEQATTYFYRSFAGNGLGQTWAPVTGTFTTQTATAPAVENLDPDSVGAFSAVVKGNVTDTGNDVPVVTLYYGPTDGGTNANVWANSVDVGEQAGEFTASIDGLDPLSDYFYTTFARNRLGEAWASTAKMFTTTDTPPLQVNEFMSDNESVLATRVRSNSGTPFVGDELAPDWIEIANPTAGIADVGGYYLTDDLGEPKKWQFPAGTVIPARGFLVVYASGLDVTDSSLDETGRLHTNFTLSGDGSDELAISDGDGDVISSIEDIPLQSEDISYGIDALGEPRFYGAPTPGETNANNTPKAPTFSVDNTTFTEDFMVELTAELPTHTIRYTTNERVPTAASTLYTGPIAISGTTNLRAISVSPDGEVSTVVSRSYIELASSVANADSNLPIVIVDTFGDAVPGTGSNFGDGAFIAIIEPGEDGRARLDGEFDLTTRGGLHVRGSSSSGFAKKQYRVEFWDEQNEDLKQSVLGMPREADWIFYAPNQFDRALVSNPLMYDLSNQIGRYATRTRWVEMYLNRSGTVSSSDYVGVYAIIEVIEAGDDRVDVGDLSTGAGGQPVEGGFIWKNDRGSAYVDPDPANSRQRSYINSFISGLTSAARSAGRGDPETGYEAWADVPSFIDHNLLNLFAMNVDALRLSSFYHKTPDGKLAAGPIWDFDRSLDSTDGRDNNPRSWYGTGDSTRYFDDSSRVRTWWPDMAKDPDFVQLYIDRWAELRDNEFSLDNLNATIDKHAAEIGEAADRDYDRWNIRDRFSSEISQMKSWIRRRVEWIDDQWLARPGFSLDTPQVAPGTGVSLTSETGTVYYTLDGTDPRGDNGAIRPEAMRADGPIVINGLTRITARVYEQGHAPSRNPGYAATGDDWSAPVRQTFFNDEPAAAGTLAVTEVHYNPADATAAEEEGGFDNNDDFEFIELMNTGNQDIVLSGAALSQVETADGTEGVSFEFSNGSIQKLSPGERVLVVENVAAFEARYGDGLPVAGQWSGALSNNNELLTVSAYDGSVIHQFRYNDGGSWPSLADGTGASLELTGDPLDANEPFAWSASVIVGGTPGESRVEPIGVVVNEILAHTDLPLSDSIELYNTTVSSIDISGWYLSDSANDLLKFEIPDGTVIAAGGYVVFTESDFNPNPQVPAASDFALSSSRGDDVWLTIADQSGLLPQTFVDHVDFPATPNGESMGRIPNGTGSLYPMQSNTFGSANSDPRVGPVVFSEIHYSPGSPSINAIVMYPDLVRDDLEYVEIHNPTPNAIDLTNWRIRGGIDYNFDEGAMLPANGTLLVISFEPNKVDNAQRYSAFREHHGLAPDAAVVGGYSGKLSDSGETIRIERPDAPPAEDPSFIPRLWEDVVQYSTDAAWPVVSNNGLSLNRVSANAFGSAPEGWTGSERTPGRYTSVDADFDNNGVVDVADADLVCSGIHAGDMQFDFNGDGVVNDLDVNLMVSSIFFSKFGDSNLDGAFNSTDLIVVFQANEYEDAIAGNSRWSEGDWNCDSEFDSSDLIRAFQAGDYSANAVPGEPSKSHADAKVDSEVAAAMNSVPPSESVAARVPSTTEDSNSRVRAAELAAVHVETIFATYETIERGASDSDSIDSITDDVI